MQTKINDLQLQLEALEEHQYELSYYIKFHLENLVNEVYTDEKIVQQFKLDLAYKEFDIITNDIIKIEMELNILKERNIL